MKTFVRLCVAGTAGVAALSAAGLASAATTQHNQPNQRAGHHRLLTVEQRQALKATGHVEFVKHTRQHGDVTIDVQRGKITALTPTSITLLSKGGFSHTYMLTTKTVVREKGQREAVSALMPDERVMVVAVHGPSGDVVRTISCLRPARTTTAPAAPSA